MYRVIIDYDREHDVGDHWYGGAPEYLPLIPNTTTRLYNLISLKPSTLPPEIVIDGVERLFLPHYLHSDLDTLDLYFQVGERMEWITDFGSTAVAVYEDGVDHAMRRVTFEKLSAVQDPASPQFDDEALTFPHHQFGGQPFFKQPEGHRLHCPRCTTAMTFVLQFDNDLGVSASFGDGAAAYYRWCNNCRTLGVRVEE